jgi:hypothetical protein
MATKRHKLEKIVPKLWQVDVLVGQGQVPNRREGLPRTAARWPSTMSITSGRFSSPQALTAAVAGLYPAAIAAARPLAP